MSISKRIIGLSGMGLLLIALLIGIAQQSFASQKVEDAARDTVTKVFDAAISGNYETVLEYTIDERHPQMTKEQRRQNIIDEQKQSSQLRVNRYDILSVEKVNDKKAYVTVKVYSPKNELTVKYPVFYNGIKWVIDITNSISIKDNGM
ncbi:DUF4878 domain-containing protein [Neomoorella thermoacetica]|uniref:Uncharacterized protein n=2 Tax=Neomoorella thermoacetica TaxID=1525 RepID=A0A1J5NSG1_NEOTH|nr:DUF4878 domain-containing protein [Moorella thermoacetica]AKX94405.1 hypothetical protein MOTHE_c16120 [Moorella thermoacetica]AKX97041.1 hypothetical protein MOTHA_c16950 [Moorella thermoacetica]OIQ08469.1 hypothetical protein MOOR_20120 [Moorella thermoacetica]OIQ58212.1 hypothetical protein MOCA_06370 [Moorella thermoacetica]QDA00871.1 hypothetical protein MothHH_01732 [Moorella thermoacetica]